MQGQLSTLPPGGTGPALRLSLLHSHLLPLLRPRPGAVPREAHLKWVQETLSCGFSCHHKSPINLPSLYPLALQPVLVSPGTSPRMVEGGKMTDSDYEDVWVGL